MSNEEQSVASTWEVLRVATGRGGKTDTNNNNEIKQTLKATKQKKEEKYSLKIRSRFGEAFLPYLENLESIEKPRVERKRRGKNIQKQPKTITQLPKYTSSKGNRINDYNEKRDHNV